MLHFLIVSLGSKDLLDLALLSIRRYAPGNKVYVLPLPANTIDPRMHGRTIDKWRETGQVADNDVVVVMDPDVVLLSHQWRVELVKAFTDPTVAIWGAGSRENIGPRVHASMMCISGTFWNSRWMLNHPFEPCTDPRERTWRDTGGLVCLWAKSAGWKVQPLEQGAEWRKGKGEYAWWGMQEYPIAATYQVWATMYASFGPVYSTAYMPKPLWVHLGGGSHSDPTRMTWLQRLRRWKKIRRRRRFIADVQAHLNM